jgi:beta-D-xylosidase 4
MPTRPEQTTAACWCNTTADCGGFPTRNGTETVQMAMRAGTDLDCGGTYKNNLAAAVSSGALSVSQLDQALRRLFLNRMKTGEFDPPEYQPYRQITPDVRNSAAHQQLALVAAREAIVLLENRRNHRGLPSLPLTVSVSGTDFSTRKPTVAVIGPNSNCTQMVRPHGPNGDSHCNQLGNYATESPFVITPAQGIGRFANVVGCQGSNISTLGPPTDADRKEFGDAAKHAASADAVVLVVGTLVQRDKDYPALFNSSCCEGEGNDRPGVSIPAVQLQLVEAVANTTAALGKPLIVCVMSGGFLDLSPWKHDSRISALLWTAYPGMMGGLALAEVLFGKVSPSGRLPYQILDDASVRSISPMRLDMRPDSQSQYTGRSYRFYADGMNPNAAPPIYQFGWGLSFTNFTYEWANEIQQSCSSDIKDATPQAAIVDAYLRMLGGTRDKRMLATSSGPSVVEHRVNVSNSGTVSSAVTVLAFAAPPSAGTAGLPIKQLFGFHKVYLIPGQSEVLSLWMVARDLTAVREDGDRFVPRGKWRVHIGARGEAAAIVRGMCM